MLIIRHAWLNLLDKHMITGRKANIEEGIVEKWGRGFGQFTDLSGEGGWVGLFWRGFHTSMHTMRSVYGKPISRGCYNALISD